MDNNLDNKQVMLRKVMELDFFAHDLQLFLNTHPTNKEALETYTLTVQKAKNAREEYESVYGPLTPQASSSVSPWQWSKSPWTWEKERG